MELDKIISWISNNHMIKIIDKTKKNIVLINSSILRTITPKIQTLSTEYIIDNFVILTETYDSLTLRNIHDSTQIIIKKA